ncbi:recombinase family protein [Nocardia tengchongensis]|uniref:recombinase family protein n=1 Tax=Nocardia tengchongensis TaxID=2055889 RepID=UPI0036C1BC96
MTARVTRSDRSRTRSRSPVSVILGTSSAAQPSTNHDVPQRNSITVGPDQGLRELRCFLRQSGTPNRSWLDNALAAVTSAAAVVDGRQVVLTTTKFDRFARKMAEAGEILTDLRGREVLFGLGSSIYDWNDPFSKLLLQTLAMVAEFEANLNHLRTREGMAKARAKGRLKGKQPKLPLAVRKTIHRRYHDASDDASLADLAEEYSIGRST